MQNLYMMAALIRENQMNKMAKEIVSNLISVEQAMLDYGVSSKEHVIARVEMLKAKNKLRATKPQSETADLAILAA